MPRLYDAPVQQPAQTSARIVYFGMRVVYGTNGAATAASYWQYRVEILDAVGNVVDTRTNQIPWPDIPSARHDDLRTLYALCLQHAQTTGLIQAGTDSGDL